MTKQELPMSHQVVIEMMQAINFGRIEGMIMEAGRPNFYRPYRTVHSVKLTGEGHPPSKRPDGDFVLREAHVALSELMKGLPDGARLTIDIRHGLPFMAEAEIEQRHVA